MAQAKTATHLALISLKWGEERVDQLQSFPGSQFQRLPDFFWYIPISMTFWCAIIYMAFWFVIIFMTFWYVIIFMTFWFIPISMTYQTDSVTWPGHVFSLVCSQPDLARWGGREPVDVSCPVCVRICHNKSHCDDIVLHCDHSHSFLFRNSSQKVSLSSDTVMSSLKQRV